MRSDDGSAVRELGLAVLDRLKYKGPGAVCFKCLPSRDGVGIIEVNARLPLMHGLASYCGIDLPWIAYCEALGIPPGFPISGPRTFSGSQSGTIFGQAAPTCGEGISPSQGGCGRSAARECLATGRQMIRSRSSVSFAYCSGVCPEDCFGGLEGSEELACES